MNRLNVATPVNIGIVPTFNSGTRMLDVEVKVDYVDYVRAGAYRVTLYLTEKWCCWIRNRIRPGELPEYTGRTYLLPGR